jgi:DNA-binding transcriptional LysR family regulator
MRKTNLRSIDLNLLIALEVLLEEKSVTRAGDRIYLSQPAMSRSLGKLRLIFDDHLLVKSGRKMILTPKAESLQAELQRILSSIKVFVSSQEFVPEMAAGKMTISASDGMIASFLAQTVKNIVFQAPNVHFTLKEPQTNDSELLRQGRLDLLLDSSHPASDLHYKQLLIDNRVSCLVRKGHRLEGRKLTKKRFLQEGHIELRTPMGRIIENSFKKKEYRRRLALCASSLISASAITAQTNWIFTVPTIFALTAIKMFDLAMLEPPFRLIEADDEPTALYMVWHERCNAEPLHSWVRDLLVKQFDGWRYL